MPPPGGPPQMLSLSSSGWLAAQISTWGNPSYTKDFLNIFLYNFNTQEFLNYLNAAIPKSLILEIHKEVEGQDTKYDYKLIKNIIHNMLKGGKQ